VRAVRQRVQQGCHKGIDKTCRPRDAFELAQQPSMRALCRYAVHYGEWRQRWGRWEEEEEEKEEEGLGGGGPLPLLLLLLLLLLKLLFSSSMGFLFLLLRRSCPSPQARWRRRFCVLQTRPNNVLAYLCGAHFVEDCSAACKGWGLGLGCVDISELGL